MISLQKYCFQYAFSSTMEKMNNCSPSLEVIYHLKKCFNLYFFKYQKAFKFPKIDK